MLVLARKSREAVVIAHAGELRELVRITVIEIAGDKVKIGFEAKNDLAIHRDEVWQRVCGELREGNAKQAIERPKYGAPYID